MCKRLNVAKVYRVELEYGGLCEGGIDAFLQLLGLFDIKVAYRSDDDRELEIERTELERLCGLLSEKNKAYADRAEAVEELLSAGGVTCERMTEAIGILISESDPDDSLVYLFCD